ncbi:hypothetical protein CABS01_11289 [Colletotrichum abscissum]|uniref:uncharacterized protein n=1 Tax=Colletotrichum abscissum TaxID=1671311 RepID=UPI0027D53305|nr:uncharacterized protein CABS01_11289 [Colletotrichum abscissum]KAK1495061.1 hypothetical protein CABS01_11289 [Colletotrichum abscissum]
MVLFIGLQHIAVVLLVLLLLATPSNTFEGTRLLSLAWPSAFTWLLPTWFASQ